MAQIEFVAVLTQRHIYKNIFSQAIKETVYLPHFKWLTEFICIQLIYYIFKY